MQFVHSLVAGMAALVVVVAVLSGPLVGAVDLTEPEQESFSPGTGSIEVTVEDTPETVILRPGAYDTGVYYYQVPDTTLAIDAVTGQPMLVYKIAVPELRITRVTTHFLSPDTEGPYQLGLAPGRVTADKITREQYQGELRVLTRTDGGEEVHHRSNISVVVRE
jgi:hypothetical protein